MTIRSVLKVAADEVFTKQTVLDALPYLTTSATFFTGIIIGMQHPEVAPSSWGMAALDVAGVTVAGIGLTKGVTKLSELACDMWDKREAKREARRERKSGINQPTDKIQNG